jgi:hypothetical protein
MHYHLSAESHKAQSSSPAACYTHQRKRSRVSTTQTKSPTSKVTLRLWLSECALYVALLSSIAFLIWS